MSDAATDPHPVKLTVKARWEQWGDAGPQRINAIAARDTGDGMTYDAALSQPGTWRFLPAVKENE